MSVRVAVIGAGHVGATFAYALLQSGLAAEIVLVDVDRPRLEGEVMDLVHAAPFARPARVRAGSLADCAGADVIVLAAGPGQRPGQTRLDLARGNLALFRSLVPEVARHAPGALLLVATNPVDLLTRLAVDVVGPRALGSGTILDTARFRALLGHHCGVDPRNVHAYILGEHGDSEVAAWSIATVAGMPIPAFCAAAGRPWDDATRSAIFAETRDAAAAIIRRKGATWYAIASGLVRIVEAVVRDQRTVLTVSVPVGYGAPGLCMSLPCVIGAGGVEHVLHVDLEAAEQAALRRSAAVLDDAWRQATAP
jgi:L-lactate dehydrogenase